MDEPTSNRDCRHPSPFSHEPREAFVRRDGTPIPVPGFQIKRPIGKGANGRVFLATDTVLQRQVAIKFWNKLLNDEDSRALEETRKIANLEHPLFARVFQFSDVNGTPCAVMEFIRGVTARAWLTTNAGRERWRLWNSYVQAMRYLYEQNILHGDPHVGNIMIMEPQPPERNDAGRRNYYLDIKILDTGTSKLMGRQKLEFRETRILIETAGKIFGSRRLEKMKFKFRGCAPVEFLDLMKEAINYSEGRVSLMPSFLSKEWSKHALMRAASRAGNHQSITSGNSKRKQPAPPK